MKKIFLPLALVLVSILLILGSTEGRVKRASMLGKTVFYPFLHSVKLFRTNSALKGEIGESVHCSIYRHRPSPCREFSQSGEGGEVNEACNRARARYGLPPLIPLYKDILSLTAAAAATCEGFAVQSPAS